jgi:hypothetical protein
MKALARPLTEHEERVIRRALKNCWSDKTGAWTSDNERYPSSNQCIQTSLVIFEKFGGEILRAKIPSKYPGHVIDHFYNRIGGQRYDFTSDQFDRPEFELDWPKYYKDDLSSDSEALTKLAEVPFFLDEMRYAFEREFLEEIRVQIHHPISSGNASSCRSC